MRVLFSVVLFILCGGMVVLFLSSYFLATKFWLADLVTSGFFQIAIVIALCLAGFIFLHQFAGVLLAAAALVVMLALLPQAPQETTDQEGESITILQYNLLAERKSSFDFVGYIQNKQPAEMIFLQEVSPQFAKELQGLNLLYPFHSSYKQMCRTGLAVFSKVPLHKVSLLDDGLRDYLRVAGKTRGGKIFVIYNVHFSSPRSKQQWVSRNHSLSVMAQKISNEAAEYRLIVGDFNTPTASPWLHKLSEESDLQVALRGGASLYSWSSFKEKNWWNSTLIDHLMISQNIYCSDRKQLVDFGSDHLPIRSHLVLY